MEFICPDIFIIMGITPNKYLVEFHAHKEMSQSYYRNDASSKYHVESQFFKLPVPFNTK